MSKGSLLLSAPLLGYLIACSGVAASQPARVCVDRIEDGSWYQVGASSPPEEVLAKAFRTGGKSALVELLGAPQRDTAEELIWVYEQRREYVRETCNPPHLTREYDQAFSILRIKRSGSDSECIVEVKEFIGESLIAAADALVLPRTPLGSLPRKCGGEE